ncbi:MAG: aminotransferase class V-fold PLP-dependent enzyme, partial [Nitrosarchaeum sp.]|nr:aminotransferase class V-fold PLP-dependent enzyme [Nitrosarchaeum sp.]
MRLKAERLRDDFPVLEAGRKLTYFDNACMTLRPRQVIDAVREYHEEFPACGERSMHRLGRRVDESVEQARKVGRKFLGARKDSE